MAFRWCAHDVPTLNASFVIFEGIGTSIAKKPYILVIFRGGGGGLVLLSPPPLWIRACGNSLNENDEAGCLFVLYCQGLAYDSGIFLSCSLCSKTEAC